MNLFLLVCVVVCLIIMNSFTYKYNSFYAKIKISFLVLNEIKHFKQELIYSTFISVLISFNLENFTICLFNSFFINLPLKLLTALPFLSRSSAVKSLISFNIASLS